MDEFFCQWRHIFVVGGGKKQNKVETAFYCLIEKKDSKKSETKDFNGIALTSSHRCLKQWRRGSETKSDDFFVRRKQLITFVVEVEQGQFFKPKSAKISLRASFEPKLFY